MPLAGAPDPAALVLPVVVPALQLAMASAVTVSSSTAAGRKRGVVMP
jgi:hypothetical protein